MVHTTRPACRTDEKPKKIIIAARARHSCTFVVHFIRRGGGGSGGIGGVSGGGGGSDGSGDGHLAMSGDD
jgi:hypothetical protein